MTSVEITFHLSNIRRSLNDQSAWERRPVTAIDPEHHSFASEADLTEAPWPDVREDGQQINERRAQFENAEALRLARAL